MKLTQCYRHSYDGVFEAWQRDITDTRKAYLWKERRPTDPKFEYDYWVEIIPDLPIFLPAMLSFTVYWPREDIIGGRIRATGTFPPLDVTVVPGEDKTAMALAGPSSKIEIRIEAVEPQGFGEAYLTGLSVIPPDSPGLKVPAIGELSALRGR